MANETTDCVNCGHMGYHHRPECTYRDPIFPTSADQPCSCAGFIDSEVPMEHLLFGPGSLWRQRWALLVAEHKRLGNITIDLQRDTDAVTFWKVIQGWALRKDRLSLRMSLAQARVHMDKMNRIGEILDRRYKSHYGEDNN